jgi:hypothetical protein
MVVGFELEVDYELHYSGQWIAFLPSFPGVYAIAPTQDEAARKLILLVKVAYDWAKWFPAIA